MRFSKVDKKASQILLTLLPLFGAAATIPAGALSALGVFRVSL